MVNVLLQLIVRFRVAAAELAGVLLIVWALSFVAGWAAMIAAGVALLIKSVEWDLKRSAGGDPS